MAEFMPVRGMKIYKARKHGDHNIYKALYRFSEENVERIAEIFLPETGESRGGAIKNKQKVEIFLRYMGDPGFQVGVADNTGVHQSSVSRTIDFVSQNIYEHAQNWIKFPTTREEIMEARLQWQNAYTFPAVAGAIDCTQIAIQKPREHGDEYINRKGFASINVQATCNSREEFTSADASWPGSVHDSRILRNSDIYARLLQNNGQLTLLGDGGYGIAPWMLTPYRNPQNDIENYYNIQHSTNRVIIERCFGQLKRRFPILGYKIRLKLDRISRIIICGFVLHNIAKHVNDADDFQELFPDVHDNAVGNLLNFNNEYANVRVQGEQKRTEIARILFNRRH